MIITNGYSSDRSYFAAANGYNGFRSLFGEIFDSYSMSRIYVLKGGPGTGKSTILKGLLLHSVKRGYYTEAIYCSSDPSSLDGVILSSNKGRVAVLDGTAPHERDAVIPGAVDEIINLTEGFDIARLASQRDRILMLTQKKKSAYNRAYSHLGAAGSVWNDICIYYAKYADYSAAEMKAKDICGCIKTSCGAPPRRVYTSAFGSSGYSKVSLRDPDGKARIAISGDGVGEHILMRFVKKELSERGAIRELHPSPFSDDIAEKIITDDTVIEISDSVADVRLANHDTELDPTLKNLFDIHAKLLDMSRDEFAEASAHHFALEDIYSGAVNFAFNDRVFDRMTLAIDAILAP